jgi:hypothetical protein
MKIDLQQGTINAYSGFTLNARSKDNNNKGIYINSEGNPWYLRVGDFNSDGNNFISIDQAGVDI